MYDCNGDENDWNGRVADDTLSVPHSCSRLAICTSDHNVALVLTVLLFFGDEAAKPLSFSSKIASSIFS